MGIVVKVNRAPGSHRTRSADTELTVGSTGARQWGQTSGRPASRTNGSGSPSWLAISASVK